NNPVRVVQVCMGLQIETVKINRSSLVSRVCIRRKSSESLRVGSKVIWNWPQSCEVDRLRLDFSVSRFQIATVRNDGAKSVFRECLNENPLRVVSVVLHLALQVRQFLERIVVEDPGDYMGLGMFEENERNPGKNIALPQTRSVEAGSTACDVQL